MTQKDAHWFESVARYLGDSYLKYSFTKGTKQEIDFLVETLPLVEGDRVIATGVGGTWPGTVYGWVVRKHFVITQRRYRRGGGGSATGSRGRGGRTRLGGARRFGYRQTPTF